MLVRVTASEGGLPEWAMVELQGKLESTSVQEEDITEIGTLEMSADKAVVRLTIGYHRLEGKQVELKKPFAILEKVVIGSSEGAGEGAEGSTTSYRAVGVVRSKLLFKNRPTALISKPRR